MEQRWIVDDHPVTYVLQSVRKVTIDDIPNYPIYKQVKTPTHQHFFYVAGELTISTKQKEERYIAVNLKDNGFTIIMPRFTDKVVAEMKKALTPWLLEYFSDYLKV